MSGRIRGAAMLAATIFLGGSCLAADIPPSRKAAPAAAPVAVQRYGEKNPSCSKWTDGCVICTRSGCSNIGIACQPAATTCTDPVSR